MAWEIKKPRGVILTFLVFGLIVLGLILVFWAWKKPPLGQAGVSDNVFGWAWAENIGWISFNSLNCDGDGDGDGLSDGTPPGCPAAGTPIPSYGVNIELDGRLSGRAWSEGVGWISFERSDMPLSDNVPPSDDPCPPPDADCIAKVDLSCPSDYCWVDGWARACGIPPGGSVVDFQCGGGGWDGWIKLRGVVQGS